MTERAFSSVNGLVSMVGAGPGPVDLMTLRAPDRVRRSDVVVHDRLMYARSARRVVRLAVHRARDDACHDWRALALPGPTRVFYLGVQRLAQIAESLLTHGLAPDTPSATVWGGTRPTQTVIACSLHRLVALAAAYGPQPGVLIIGETVRMCPEFRVD